MFTEHYAPGLPKTAEMLCTWKTVRATSGNYSSVEDQGKVPRIQPVLVSFCQLDRS